MINLSLSFWNSVVSGGGGGGTIAVGRNAKASISGTGSSITINFSGGAPVAGTRIIFISANSTGGGTGIPSGGTNPWTQIASFISYYYIYEHVCDGSEPSSYTVSYGGSSKSDGLACAMIEILNANSVNPDGSATANSTTSTPSLTSTTANDISIALWASNVASAATSPAGYTEQVNCVQSASFRSVVISTATNVGTGTIAPGTWSIAGSLVGHILEK